MGCSPDAVKSRMSDDPSELERSSSKGEIGHVSGKRLPAGFKDSCRVHGHGLHRRNQLRRSATLGPRARAFVRGGPSVCWSGGAALHLPGGAPHCAAYARAVKGHASIRRARLRSVIRLRLPCAGVPSVRGGRGGHGLGALDHDASRSRSWSRTIQAAWPGWRNNRNRRHSHPGRRPIQGSNPSGRTSLHAGRRVQRLGVKHRAQEVPDRPPDGDERSCHGIRWSLAARPLCRLG